MIKLRSLPHCLLDILTLGILQQVRAVCTSFFCGIPVLISFTGMESMRVPFSSMRKLLSVVYQVDAEKVKGYMTSFSTLLKRLFKVRDLKFTSAQGMPSRPAPNPHARFKSFQGLEMKEAARALVAKAATPRRTSASGAPFLQNTPVSRSLFSEPEDDSPSPDFILINSTEAYIIALPLPFCDSCDYIFESLDQEIVVRGSYEPDFQRLFPSLFTAPVSLDDIESPLMGDFEVHHQLPDNVYNPAEREPIRCDSTCGPLFVFEFRPTLSKKYQIITCRSFDRSHTSVSAPCVTEKAPREICKTIAASKQDEFSPPAARSEEIKQDTSSALNESAAHPSALLPFFSMLTEEQKSAMKLVLGVPSNPNFQFSLPAMTGVVTKPTVVPFSTSSQCSPLKIASCDRWDFLISFLLPFRL